MHDPLDYHKRETEPGYGEAPQSAVVLVHYGPPDTTWRCVRSLLASEGPRVSIFISDHGPDAPLESSLPADVPSQNIHILALDNPGFGAGCNAAAQLAFGLGAEWIWFLNNDAMVESPVLSDLERLARNHPEVGLWGTLQRDGARLLGADHIPDWYPTPGGQPLPGLRVPDGCRLLGPRETLSGASILVSRKAWDQVGPWPEWCFLYWEDTTWCLKAHSAGLPLVMTGLEVLHLRNTTTGHHSPTTTYYGARNSLLLHQDCWPALKWQRLFQACHLLQKRFFQGRWRLLGPTWRGILDAWRGRRFRRG